MKHKATSLYLGLCLAVWAVAASPAYARTVTGFGAFKVQVQGTTGTNSYLCLGESYGAVVNNCSVDVNLAFDLPIDNSGNHTVNVQDYFLGGQSSFPFNCSLYSWSDTSSSYWYGGQITFTGPVQSQSFSANAESGWSLMVYCTVPPGGGITNLNYNP